MSKLETYPLGNEGLEVPVPGTGWDDLEKFADEYRFQKEYEQASAEQAELEGLQANELAEEEYVAKNYGEELAA